MRTGRGAIRGRLKWYGVAFCCLIIANGLVTLSTGGARVRRLGENSECATNGVGLLYLWSATRGSSIAWACPELGPVPKLRMSRQQVFLYFPLWTPLIVVAAGTAVLFWLKSRNLKPGMCIGGNYEVTGHTSGVCPKCDKIVPAQQDDEVAGK